MYDRIIFITNLKKVKLPKLYFKISKCGYPLKMKIFGSELAKNGGVSGEEIFCPRAGSEAPPSTRERGAEQKNCLYIF